MVDEVFERRLEFVVLLVLRDVGVRRSIALDPFALECVEELTDAACLDIPVADANKPFCIVDAVKRKFRRSTTENGAFGSSFRSILSALPYRVASSFGYLAREIEPRATKASLNTLSILETVGPFV
jgi:hypothetical protein